MSETVLGRKQHGSNTPLEESCMRLLILGGTVFLGRHLVDAARAAGHDVTLFHRGLHGPDLFPDLEHLRGDRDGGLAALRGRTFDAVIDTSGYLPRVVRQSTEALRDSVGHYTFISSVSAYRDLSQIGIDESAPLAELPADATEEIATWYGALKAACEGEVESAFPGRALNIRPGLIVGPDDPSERFTYWVARLARGGEVLAPGSPARPEQVIDVRDLASWTVRMVEGKGTGAYNAVGPEHPLTLLDVIRACNEVGGEKARITWVTEQFLLSQGVVPWTEMPLWIPESDPESRGIDAVAIKKAVDAGLTFRPLAETVQATLDWDRVRSPEAPRRVGVGLRPEREAELLAVWHRESRD